MGSSLTVLDVSGSGSASGGEGSGVAVKKRYAPLADEIVSVDVSGDGKLFATGNSNTRDNTAPSDSTSCTASQLGYCFDALCE